MKPLRSGSLAELYVEPSVPPPELTVTAPVRCWCPSFSQTVPPFKVDNDVVYLQAKGSIYRRFNFNLYANIYTGEDITINSSQLFTGYTIREHAWCEEPYKLLWAVRDDGDIFDIRAGECPGDDPGIGRRSGG